MIGRPTKWAQRLAGRASSRVDERARAARGDKHSAVRPYRAEFERTERALFSEVVAEVIQRYDARRRTRRTAGTRKDRGGVADMTSTSAFSRM